MEDGYAEYYDETFLDRLQIGELQVPLGSFWPRGGPRWDGLARSSTGKLLLVEAKAYVEEGVTFSSKASDASMQQIVSALEEAKRAFQARADAPWATPFYQYANRLAHLHFLRGLNDRDAYLLFLNFADAPDVPRPATTEEFAGASRTCQCALGLGQTHPYSKFIKTINWSVPQMLSST